MTNKPVAITSEEFNEIASSEELQEMWGVNSVGEMKKVLGSDYVVKFEFMAGSPGYVGDLFIVQSDCLDSDIPATRMIRGQDDQLVILR